MATKCCSQCNKEYKKRPQQAYWQYKKSLYCSKSCKGKAQGFQKIVQPTKTCDLCQKVYTKASNQPMSWWITSKYCSQKCFINAGVSQITREKHRLDMLGNKNGLGHSPSLEHREKISIAGKARWDKIGRNPKPNPRANRLYREWRNTILQRDNFTCQDCSLNDKGTRLEIHHIKPFALFPELRFDSMNVVTLCRDCHKKTDSYGAKLKKNYVSAS